MESFNRLLFLSLVTASVVFTHPTNGGDNVYQQEKLRHDLFDKYDLKTMSHNVTVKFGLELITFDIHEVRSNVAAGVWTKYVWEDSRLAWDKAEYGGIEELKISADDLWKPDITIYNSADQDIADCVEESNVRIDSTGEIFWVPLCYAGDICELPLEEDPDANQNCRIEIVSWPYDGHSVDLQLLNDIEEIVMSEYWNPQNSKLEIVSTSAKKEQPNPYLTFDIIFKRRSNLISHKNSNDQE